MISIKNDFYTLKIKTIVFNINTAIYPPSKFFASFFLFFCCTNFHTNWKTSTLFIVLCFPLCQSFFENVPVDGAIHCLQTRSSEYKFLDFKVKEFIKVAKLCISNIIFEFNGKFYKQSECLITGNPLSPILSDIYMHYFEEKLLKLLNFKCWMRYVDDTFPLFENPFNISIILETANNTRSYIQFTFELEN